MKTTNEFIPVNQPLLAGNEKKYINDCIDTGWISSEGSYVKEFEKQMAQLTNRKHAFSVNSGTSALELALKALDLPEGSEVLVPSFTMIACLSSIVKAGLKPKFMDCDLSTYNSEISFMEKALTPQTKAVLLVHIYGLPLDLKPILKLAKDKNLLIVEDAAQMHGQMYNDKPCGSFGDISTFSFYANKTITCGEGGMVLTNNPKYAERIGLLRNHYFNNERRFVHEDLGYSLRMTNIQAAIGLAQTEQLNKTVLRKREIAQNYNELFSKFNLIDLPHVKTDYAESIYWAYGLSISKDIKVNADTLALNLKKKLIGTRPFFWPLHLQPCLGKYDINSQEKLENAEFLGEKGLYIPNSLSLTDEQQEYIADCLKEELSKLAN